MKTVVIGTGMAGMGFAEAYRKLAPDADVTVFTFEKSGYYSRPLLSHGFANEAIFGRTVMKTFDTIREAGLKVMDGAEVVRIVPEKSQVEYKAADGSNQSIGYDRLVIATGSEATVPPPWLGQLAEFERFNSYDDLKKMRARRDEIKAQGGTPHWAIVGGGLIGCEVGADLLKAGDKVTIFHAVDRLMERQLDEAKSAELLIHMRASGADVRLNMNVTKFQRKDGKVTLTWQDGEETFDEALVTVGFRPRTDIAKAAGLTVNRGIVVNDKLQTSVPNIYAIGDVAECAGFCHAFVIPIRSQVTWLAQQFATPAPEAAWATPVYKPMAKIHGFKI